MALFEHATPIVLVGNPIQILSILSIGLAMQELIASGLQLITRARPYAHQQYLHFSSDIIHLMSFHSLLISSYERTLTAVIVAVTFASHEKTFVYQ